MKSQSIMRAATAIAAALLLGGAFLIGTTLSSRQARAATLTLPIATTSGSTASGQSPTQGISTSGQSPTQGITVSGSSQVAGTPDTLRLDLAVSTKADTVERALEQANRLAASVQDSLRHHGVAAKDLQTSDLQIQPEYSYPSNGNPVLNGYTVSEGITARLRDLGKAGAAISAASAAGGDATRINGATLDLEDTGKLMSAARDKAVGDAHSKAEQYAKALGRSLGPVMALAESVSQPPPVDYSTRSAADAVKSVPIAPGSQTVGVTVTVTYAFGQ